jgi:hypothetical protein
MIIKINFILLNTLILIMFSIIIYNLIKNTLKIPTLNNNIREKEYNILKSIGISFLVMLPIIFIQIFSKKDIVKIGINTPIRI